MGHDKSEQTIHSYPLCLPFGAVHQDLNVHTISPASDCGLESLISLKLDFSDRAEDWFFLYLASIIPSLMFSSDFRPELHSRTLLGHLNPILFYVLNELSYGSVWHVHPLSWYQHLAQLPP